MMATPIPSQYLRHYSQETRQEYDQVMIPVDVAIQLDRTLLADRPTTPTRDV